MGSRLTLTALSDTSVEGLACNAMIEDCKRALLRMHAWNFAVKRKKLVTFPQYAVSNVTFVSSELIEVTHASVTYTTGQYVTLRGIQGATRANGTWEIASTPAATTTRLTAIDVTTSDLLGTYTASDSDYIRRTPAFEYSYLFALPSDYIRMIDLDKTRHNVPWVLENGFILSNATNVEIRYIYDVTDYTTMDASFYQTLAHYLAYNLCDHLSASDAKKNELHAYLYGGQGKKGALQQARFLDSTEASVETAQADDWVLSRLVSPTAI